MTIIVDFKEIGKKVSEAIQSGLLGNAITLFHDYHEGIAGALKAGTIPNEFGKGTNLGFFRVLFTGSVNPSPLGD